MNEHPKIIVTYVRTLPDSLDIFCANCERILAKYILETDNHMPAYDEMVDAGNVAIPNFGWFCSQKCGNEYEKLKNLRFQRDDKGDINYD
jgi:hypothetical protein